MEALQVLMIPDYRRDNTYQSLLADSLAKSGVRVDFGSTSLTELFKTFLFRRPKVLHVHWIDNFILASSNAKGLVKALLFYAALAFAKLSGVKIIWTFHELIPHHQKNSLRLRIGLKAVMQFSESVITHFESAKKELVAATGLSPSKIHVIAHGHFLECYKNTCSKEIARKALDIPSEAFVFLNFGAIAPYKGILELISIFKELRNPTAHLLIAGKVFNETYLEEIKSAARDFSQIKIFGGSIPDDLIQLFFKASDIGVLPYKKISTSASLILCMGFQRACIVPKLGSLPETASDEGVFFFDPKNPQDLLSAMKKAMEDKDRLQSMGKKNFETIKVLDWSSIGQKTARLYGLLQ